MMNFIENKYYKVLCKCGHVGKKKYVPILFAVYANSKKEAAKLARYIPRVKHGHKDAILSVDEILLDEYLEISEKNLNDPYLKCKSRYEQKIKCNNLSERMVDEKPKKNYHHTKQERYEIIKYKLKKEYQIKKDILGDIYYEYCC